MVRTPACHAGGRGFEPHPSRQFASIAQSVEQGTENPCVGGSIPPRGTKHRVESNDDTVKSPARGVRFQLGQQHRAGMILARSKFGWVVEWSNTSDCKSDASGFDGSNPSPTTICWCGSMAEQLICNQQVVGSTPITSSIVAITNSLAVCYGHFLLPKFCLKCWCKKTSYLI